MNYYYYSYNAIINYLYYSNTNIENDNYNNPELAKNIIYTLKNYINKIVIFEFIRIGFDETKIYNNSILSIFLQNNNINLKNEISEIVLKQVNNLSSETLKNQRLSEKNFFTIIDKNLFINVFNFIFIDINNINNKKIIINLLKTYNNVLKFANSIEDFDFFIALIFYIPNLFEKFGIDESLKNNFFGNLNKLTFEKEIQGFIEKGYVEELEKLFIVKFIKYINNSNLKILEILEEFYEENFINFMINVIDNFKKLKKYYSLEKNKNSEFWKIIYKDFMKIFSIKNEIIYLKNLTQKKYWKETDKRNKIYKYFELIFPFYNINYENKKKTELKKGEVRKNKIYRRQDSFYIPLNIF